MADVELIVKIDENVYTRLFDNGIQDNEIAIDDICEMARALRLGKPLPEYRCDTCKLDKIRSEITELDGMYVIRDNAIYAEKIPKYERLWYVRLGEVIDILDKYKEESEDTK